MSFSNIKGHDNIKIFFKRELSSGRVASSYLFYGPPGVGKGLMAITVAKALNCRHIVQIRADEKKEVIAIEQIRELQRQINLTPYEGRIKVFIIEDAHLMSREAASCLLKTLEEPPKDSIIILITSRQEELLPTVKSRCRQLKFGPLELKTRLELAQGIGFSSQEALFLSRLENVDLGSILSILAPEGLFAHRNKALDEFGSRNALLDETNFIFGESKEGMKFIILLLGAWFRDIFVLKTGAPSSLLLNSDRMGELKEAADEFSFEELEEFLKEIEEAYFCIDRNVGPKLVLNDLKMKIERHR